MMRKFLGFGVATGITALAIFACTSDNTSGSSTSSSTSSGSSGTTSGGSSGTTSGGTSGTTTSGGTSGTASGFKQCASSSSGDAGACTEADYKPYTDCYQANCDATYKECYGADYKNGNFSGACGDFIKCTQACKCGDTDCQKACQPKFDSTCQACSAKFADCSKSCKLPACTGASQSTCADLDACCDKMSASDKASYCSAALRGALTSDLACGTYYDSTAKAKCP